MHRLSFYLTFCFLLLERTCLQSPSVHVSILKNHIKVFGMINKREKTERHTNTITLNGIWPAGGGGGGGGEVGPDRLCSATFEQLLAFGAIFPNLATSSNFWFFEQLLSNFVLIYLIRITKINLWSKGDI